MGKSFESKAQSNMYQYQAGMAQINKQIDEQNAAYARSVGEVEAQKSGMRSRFQLGGIKVAKAAGNIDVNSGSAREVQDSQEAIGQHDQSIIRSNAARQAYGYDVEATWDIKLRLECTGWLLRTPSPLGRSAWLRR
jgi:predicted RNA-binding protein